MNILSLPVLASMPIGPGTLQSKAKPPEEYPPYPIFNPQDLLPTKEDLNPKAKNTTDPRLPPPPISFYYRPTGNSLPPDTADPSLRPKEPSRPLKYYSFGEW